MSKPRGKGPSPPFSMAPQVLPCGLFMTVPVLDHPSLEECYLSLATSHALGAWQGEVNWAEVVLLPGR